MASIKELTGQLVEQGASGDNIGFEVNPLVGSDDILQIVVEDREELPIFISTTDSEILCICYLFTKDEVNDETMNEMNSAMLSMNIPMPLSSFAKIENQYVIFGALSINSSIESIVHEIELLSDNTLEALNSFKEYLK